MAPEARDVVLRETVMATVAPQQDRDAGVGNRARRGSGSERALAIRSGRYPWGGVSVVRTFGPRIRS